MHTTTKISAVLASVLLLSAGSAYAADHACSNSVNAELSRVGISTDSVSNIAYEADNTADGQSFAGYLVHVYVKDQGGHLLMSLDPRCRVWDTFTMGNYSIDGVKRY